MPTNDNRPVGVLAGGRGVLRSSSEVVAGRVRTLLESAGVAATVFRYGSEEFTAALDRGDMRLLQDVTYGVYGRAESLAAAAGLGFVGTGARQAEVYDKVRLKTFLSRARVGTPAHVVLDAHAHPSSWSAIKLLEGPIVVKPATADLLSAGVRFFGTADPWQPGLREHIGQLFTLDQTVLVERYVPGLEICLGYEVSRRGFEMYPALTITKEARLFDHAVKTSRRYAFTPVDVPQAALGSLGRLGWAMAAEFDLTGCFYVNAIVTDDGDVSVFDAGATVGLTEHSYFPAAAALRGDAVDDLLVRQFVQPVEDLLRRDGASHREPAEMETH
ncbi:hypothetical protein [Amycolatopsis balhimycina]|uniref:hypothetical protein n=1 Tax=Amycolatopsis balhimycina TaxID=208443 RepID=UPI00037FD684|nr:hypothetical protein [Amycolatopsis balhimycina]